MYITLTKCTCSLAVAFHVTTISMSFAAKSLVFPIYTVYCLLYISTCRLYEGKKASHDKKHTFQIFKGDLKRKFLLMQMNSTVK